MNKVTKIERGIVAFSIISSLLLILIRLNFVEALMLFIIAGIIPGTDLVLPPIVSIIIVITAGLALIIYPRRKALLSFLSSITGKKGKLPRRRFSQI